MMSNTSMIGPSLPPSLITGTSTCTEPNDEPQAVIGPQLPPTHKEDKSTHTVSYGPSLPPGMTYGPSIVEESENISVCVIKDTWLV